MYEKLSTLLLPVDYYLREMNFNNPSLKKICGSQPVESLITLELVTSEEVVQLARQYISQLLKDKEQYGYLYFLSEQKMLIPLSVRFQGTELFIDHVHKDEILTAINQIAREFACYKTQFYDITLVELYYFFIRLVNPKLSWLAVESIIQSARLHAHLFMSTDRKYHWTTENNKL